MITYSDDISKLSNSVTAATVSSIFTICLLLKRKQEKQQLLLLRQQEQQAKENETFDAKRSLPAPTRRRRSRHLLSSSVSVVIHRLIFCSYVCCCFSSSHWIVHGWMPSFENMNNKKTKNKLTSNTNNNNNNNNNIGNNMGSSNVPQATATATESTVVQTSNAGSTTTRRRRKVMVSASAGKQSTYHLRIRTTQESDLPTIAKLLSTASVASQKKSPWDFQHQINQLIAQADIEQLLKCRLQTIQEGRKAWQRLNTLLEKQEQVLLSAAAASENGAGVGTMESDLLLLSSQDWLRLLWCTPNISDRFKALLAKASADTGEDNVWRHHNIALPPADESWLNHLQITAVLVEDDDDLEQQQQKQQQKQSNNQKKETVVAFCEVAMLRNPLVDDNSNNNNNDHPHESSSLLSSSFSPAITNLAVDPNFRRQGIASELLQTASRFCRQYFLRKAAAATTCDTADTSRTAATAASTSSLSLYVETENQAAIALYANMGFQAQTILPAAEKSQLGELCYMSKRLQQEETRTKSVVGRVDD